MRILELVERLRDNDTAGIVLIAVDLPFQLHNQSNGKLGEEVALDGDVPVCLERPFIPGRSLHQAHYGVAEHSRPFTGLGNADPLMIPGGDHIVVILHVVGELVELLLLVLSFAPQTKEYLGEYGPQQAFDCRLSVEVYGLTRSLALEHAAENLGDALNRRVEIRLPRVCESRGPPGAGEVHRDFRRPVHSDHAGRRGITHPPDRGEELRKSGNGFTRFADDAEYIHRTLHYSLDGFRVVDSIYEALFPVVDVRVFAAECAVYSPEITVLRDVGACLEPASAV